MQARRVARWLGRGIILLLTLAGLGCTAEELVNHLTFKPTIAPTVLPPPPEPPPIACTQNPEGLILQVFLGPYHPAGQAGRPAFQDIRITGQGFMPNEQVSIVVDGKGTSHGSKIEVPHLSIKADGSLDDLGYVQLDEPNMQWKVYVIHQRGTACAEFTTR